MKRSYKKSSKTHHHKVVKKTSNNGFFYKIALVLIVLGVLTIVALISIEKPTEVVEQPSKVEPETPTTTIPFEEPVKDLLGQAYNLNIGSSQVTINIPLETGLNLISIPIEMEDEDIAEIFPGYLNAYVYYNENQIWEKTTTITGGEIYFVVYPSEKTFTITGVPIFSYQTNINPGWNTIASVYNRQTFNYEFPLLETTLITYNPKTASYKSSNTIEPGKGYFVLSDQQGTVNVNGKTNYPATPEEVKRALEYFGSRPPSP